jgi:hypothetical protein
LAWNFSYSSSLWVWWFLDTHERAREFLFLLWGFIQLFQWSLWQNYPTFGHLGVTSVNSIWLKTNPLIVFD